jgi:hypothetical protein
MKRYPRVYVYAQQCCRAGELARPEEGDEHSDDLLMFAGSPRSLRREAKHYREIAGRAPAGTDTFYRRVAATLHTEAEYR